MLPDFPKTKSKLHQLFTLEMRLYRDERSNIFGMLPKYPVMEGNESLYIYEDGSIRETQFHRCEDEFILDIRNTDERTIEAVYNKWMDLAESLSKQASGHLFDTLTQVTKETGNTIKANGKSFTVEHFLEALSMMSFEFDSKGEAMLPTIFAGPKLAEEMGVELKKLDIEPYKLQHEEIISKKRAEFIERESNRKLVD